ncbi:MAG: ECF transporter S component [Clostridia bacterium]|nr:ECF transporter S component [Clostridia bacterium]
MKNVNKKQRNKGFYIKEVCITPEKQNIVLPENKPWKVGESIEASGAGRVKKKKTSLTLRLVFTAMFAAVLTISDAYLAIRLPDGEINFNLVISFFAGVFLGGPLGFVAGVVGDFFGWLLFVDGMYNPILSLTSGLVCFVPGIVFTLNNKRAQKGKRAINSYLLAFLSSVFCYVFFTIILKSFGLWIFTSSLQSKYSLFAYFIRRVITQSLNSLSNCALVLLLIFPLRKIKYFKGIL